eukprot:5518131-Prorocentrum_lima.AAC.1
MKWVCKQAEWPPWEEVEDNDDGVREAWMCTGQTSRSKPVEKQAGWHTFFRLQENYRHVGWQCQGNDVAWNTGPPNWYATNAVGHYDIDLLDVLATFMGFARETRPREM